MIHVVIYSAAARTLEVSGTHTHKGLSFEPEQNALTVIGLRWSIRGYCVYNARARATFRVTLYFILSDMIIARHARVQ